ncbi:MAG: site-2 protease family protein [Bacteroidales bacterium]|nr:site-2 protease family protein [Bacteroidales bacterium]
MDGINLVQTLKLLPGIILGLTIHEFSHAFMAHRCGDSTSRDQGRVTLNPLKHIDPLGFIMLLIAGFGWAKPVQFNELNLRNPGKDVIKIALAGPLSNAVAAIVLSVCFFVVNKFVPLYDYHEMPLYTEVFLDAILINWSLFIFNLIPIPPLDGSHLLLSQFKKFPNLYAGLYKYGTFVLLALIVGSMLTKINFFPIWPVISFLGYGFLSLLGIHF